MREPWAFENPLCAEVGTEIFFPDKEDNPISTMAAYSICARCSHKTECLEWAIETNEVGIWGGTTPKGRQRLRSIRKRKSA